MTADTRNSTAPSRSRARWAGALVVSALVCGGIYVISTWPEAAAPPPPPPDTLAYNPQAAQARPTTDWLAMRDANDLLLTRPGDTPLASEPADLPPLSQRFGDRAQRIAGVRNASQTADERRSHWVVTGADAQTVASFYNEAAAAQGFTALPIATGSGSAVSRSYHRPAADGTGVEVLTVRVTPTPQGARVLIWLRS